MSSRSALSEELLAALKAGATLVTPNQRSAHSLRLLYANRAAAGGSRAWATPNIVAFNSFVAGLWRDTSNRRGERLLSTEQAKLLWERVVAQSDWSSALLSPQAAASASFRSWERMHQWHIGRAALTEHVQRYENAEARALLEWSDRFD